ncbi:CheR family methyltransferase [Parerythrobacter aestuarii]|uniref:CheR family methyltransferase n=1 Tax=Parerythrobacter aestuarii TaxID=3020909 RepID=UPI0024DEC0AE|nr:CheR family methyltransferase [Parerythrobacter aestuarii]
MWRISGALSGIFRQYDISNVDQLVCLLAEPRAEELARNVVEALLNNETYFFRDKLMFDQLAESILPQLWEQRQAQRTLRIWSAGCSSGQELYSVAMLLLAQRERWSGWHIDLLGTDVSTRIIAAARKGCFSQFEVQRGLTVSQMLGYFDQRDDGWCPQQELRKMVTFREHNLLERAPVEAPFDLVLCRNVLLYFDPATRSRVFDRLHEAIHPDGRLMLGAGETVIGQTERFVPAGDGSGLYAPITVSGGLRLRA